MKLIGIEVLREGVILNEVPLNLYNKLQKDGIGDFLNLGTALSNYKTNLEGLIVLGLENKELFDKHNRLNKAYIYTDNYRSPYSYKRSEHYIHTLSNEYNSKYIKGNVILNSGSFHNDDIIFILLENYINAKMLKEFNIIRFRAQSHPLK